jgi:hypothetical protein
MHFRHTHNFDNFGNGNALLSPKGGTGTGLLSQKSGTGTAI